MQNQPVSSFSDLIQGREPGLVGLPSSGTTGEGARIRIRGSASLSQSNEPIVYVDGVRVDRGGGFGEGVSAGGQGSPSRLDDIPPESIERIEVLKGAAAATLYGTEASNGVIQIFTKRGTQGAPRWSFQVEQSLIDAPTDRMIPHADFAETQEDIDRIAQRWGRNVGLFEPFQEMIFPEVLETGYGQTYSGSVQGGGDLITYFVSGRYFNEDGPMGWESAIQARDHNVKRQATANINVFPTDDLRIRFSGLYSEVNHETFENSNNIFGVFSSMFMSHLRLAREGNRFGSLAFGTTKEFGQATTTQDTEHFAGSINANWTLAEGLVFDGTFGVDVTNQVSANFFPFGWNVDDFSTFFTDGLRSINDRNHREVTGDFKLSYQGDLSSSLSSSLVVGAQGFLRQTVQSGGDGTAFPGPGLEVIGAASNQSIFEQFDRVVNAGLFAQEQIGWNDYAFFTVGGRFDANSAFGEEFDVAFYPKASGWDSETLSSFRVRAAVGQSGLQPGAFDQFTTFESLPSTQGPGVAPENLGNPELQPEVSTEWEVGAEFGLWNDRAGIDVTYWDRTVEDALVARQFPVSGGFRNTQLDNIGEVTASGVEIAVNGTAYESRQTSIDLFANASYITEKVTDMGGAPPLKVGGSYPRYRNFVKEGFAPGAYFGATPADVAIPLNLNGDCSVPTQSEALAYFSQPRDLSDFEVLSKAPDGGGIGSVGCGGDFLNNHLGKPTPDWQGSFGGNFTFLTNFELSTLFEFKAGNYHVQDLSGMFRQANAVIGRNTPEAARVHATVLDPNSTAQERLDAAIFWANNLRALDLPDARRLRQPVLAQQREPDPGRAEPEPVGQRRVHRHGPRGEHPRTVQRRPEL